MKTGVELVRGAGKRHLSARTASFVQVTIRCRTGVIPVQPAFFTFHAEHLWHLACHAAKGRTGRTEIMFSAGGCAYIYLIYGIHHMLNFVCSVKDDPQAVLIRGAIPLDDWKVELTGPGKLARHFQLTREQNGLSLTGSELYVEADSAYQPRIVQTKRIGIDYAKEWKDEQLRFIDANHVKQ